MFISELCIGQKYEYRVVISFILTHLYEIIFEEIEFPKLLRGE